MKGKNVLLAALLAASSAASAADNSTSIKVEDIGIDGDERIYRIQCEDGHKKSLTYRYKETKFCYYVGKNQERCALTDDVDEAARQACGGF